jgi:hypothetical protein
MVDFPASIRGRWPRVSLYVGHPTGHIDIAKIK